MEYRQRPDDDSGTVATGLRERFPVDRSGEHPTFEVPDDLDADAHRRLIAVGHEPLEPDALPPGVTYGNEEGASEEAESDRSSDSSEEPAEESENEEASEEPAEAGEDMPAPPEPLDEMHRSELYSYGNDELGLGLDWSGENALNEAEMRERIEEELDGA